MTRSSCEWGGAYKNASALEGEGGRVRSTLLTLSRRSWDTMVSQDESGVLGIIKTIATVPGHRSPGDDLSPKTDGVRGHRLLFPDTWCPRTPSGHGWRPRTVLGVSSDTSALGHPFAS